MAFFFNDSATTEIYTLSLHGALPILEHPEGVAAGQQLVGLRVVELERVEVQRRLAVVPDVDQRVVDDREVAQADRKSTRLNSSHANISYAVFCLKKKSTNGTQGGLSG